MREEIQLLAEPCSNDQRKLGRVPKVGELLARAWSTQRAWSTGRKKVVCGAGSFFFFFFLAFQPPSRRQILIQETANTGVALSDTAD